MGKRLGGLRAQRKRQQNRTILLVTNGAVTERRYLTELKQRGLQQLTNVSITVKVENGEPPSVMRKLWRPQSDTSAFDEVWFVFDEDGHDRSDIFATCAERTTKRQQWHAVVSRPCFEAWLVAHFGPVRRYPDQANAQAHYRELVGEEIPSKHIPQDFPYDNAAAAVKRSHLPGERIGDVTEMPPSPGSGMPHLVRRLGLIDE